MITPNTQQTSRKGDISNCVGCGGNLLARETLDYRDKRRKRKEVTLPLNKKSTSMLRVTEHINMPGEIPRSIRVYLEKYENSERMAFFYYIKHPNHVPQAFFGAYFDEINAIGT